LSKIISAKREEGRTIQNQKSFLQMFVKKQANDWIGNPRGSIFEHFIAILT
jgi:elongation factor P hydroxylase